MQYIITKEQIEEVVFLVAEHGRLSALSIKGLLQSLPILGGELWKPPLGTNPPPLFTRIDQLQTEVEALRKDAVWQPIETAPKEDGEESLFYTNEVGRCVMYWDVYDQAWGTGFDDKIPTPTHWMPLPKSPIAGEAK